MTRALTLIVGLVAFWRRRAPKTHLPRIPELFHLRQETLRKKFSYFKEDSTPKILTASKTKYLIAVPNPIAKKCADSNG